MNSISRVIASVGLIASTVFLFGCSGVGGYYQPSGIFPTAGIFMETTSGGILHDNGATATKEGKACGQGILGIVATGDTSVEAAMKNGGIKKAVYTNQYIKAILGSLYVEVCTIVKGN